MSTIRQVGDEERLNTAFTLYPYAFDRTPAPDSIARLRTGLPYHRDNHTLVAGENGTTLATATAIPTHQNLRGAVTPMAGIAWVATRPDARRQGHSSRLLHRLHRDMHDRGHRLATLFPFHPSFYQRFGYVALPLNRTATLTPGGLAPLLDVRIPGEVTWQELDAGFTTYRAFQRTLLSRRHGFTYTPDYRAARVLDPARHWLAIATVDAEVVGTLIYHIDGYGGCLHAEEMLYTDPLGRALLLRFLAQHAYQVSRITVTVAPDDFPETWVTGLTVRSEATCDYPSSPPLMARLLSMTALNGLRCDEARAEIEVVDDELLAGRYLLDGSRNTIDVQPGGSTTPIARITAAGLAGLAYGVLDPLDVVARGLGEIPADTAEGLRRLLPRRIPQSFGKG